MTTETTDMDSDNTARSRAAGQTLSMILGVHVDPDGNTPPTPPTTSNDLPDIHEGMAGVKFWRGDDSELAGVLHDRCLGQHVVSIAGEVWQYDPARCGWWRIPSELLATWVSRLAGGRVYQGMTAQGEVRSSPLTVSSSKARGAARLAGDRVHHAEERGDFWTHEVGAHRRGIAQFRDKAVIVTQQSPGRLSVTVADPKPAHRVRASRVLPCAWAGVVPWRTVPGACPVLWRVHRDWWGHHGDDEAGARLRAILEVLGASVLGFAPTMARALFLYGPGGTGKSTLIDLMTRWCKPAAVASVTPQDLATNRFASARLDGALMNVVDDLPADAIADAGVWKSAITGGRLDVERKGRDAYGIYPRAGHVYAGNRLPIAVKANSGFWRRWLVVHYDKVFAGTHADRPILHELLAEMPQIMGAAVGAFLDTGGAGGRGYTEPGCHADIMREWDRVSDSVSAFAEEHMQPIGEAPRRLWCKRSEVYRKYRAWCVDTGRRPVSAHEWTSRVRDMGFDVAKSGSWRVACEVVGLGE